MSAERTREWLSAWAADERGAVTVDALIYLFLMLFLIGGMWDATSLYQKHAQMWNAGRDAARGVARRTMTPDQAEERVRWMLAGFRGDLQVEVLDGEVVVVEIGADFRSESVFGAIGAIASSRPARITMRREPALLERLG